MDDVILEIQEDALDKIAERAIERKTGARGLRAILEDTLLNVMYDIPSTPNVEKCVVTGESIETKKTPELIINENKKPLAKTHKKAKARRQPSVS